MHRVAVLNRAASATISDAYTGLRPYADVESWVVSDVILIRGPVAFGWYFESGGINCPCSRIGQKKIQDSPPVERTISSIFTTGLLGNAPLSNHHFILFTLHSIVLCVSP